MAREEIEKKIEELSKMHFYLLMKDHWNNYDFEEDRRMRNEIRELEEMLEG